ncbi:28S ribosomal protein S31, mitochondrial [Larimichthys crocea]|uniref:Small ribosomal subunit protein mS31 n=1 Tax=Larimichthys crocea TaxID=215358 RepID=A0A6G0I9X1_LARCR|nr:28S ribosomal protein S31, mitochondrial [Larimichthys crocea]
MFRFLLRHSSVGVCRCLARCDTAAAAASVSRAAHGGAVRAFSGSSSVRLCEKKSDAASSDPTEAPAELTQKAADDGQDEVIEVAERSEEPAVLKTEEDGGPTQQQQTDVEQVTAKHGGGRKSGKESLIDLLGAMKVEVTNKRKMKNKVTQSYESTSKTADLESTITMFQQVTDQASSQSETLDPELVAAASAAASTLPNRSQAESELLRQLRQHEAVSEAQKKGETNELGVIIADMKVGRNPNRQKTWPANQIWFDEDGRGYTDDRENAAETDAGGKRRNLFTGKRLNIFSPTTEEGVESTAARPTLWDVEFVHQLTQATNHTPRNGLEEMIQWTKEGKMWQYPVNNEAGLEEEADVPFHEHIFLDKHLEDGFPRQGPVRHFMELVVAGLSRNPYVTVQQKKEHISWFRDYFHQKEEVLKEAEVYLK